MSGVKRILLNDDHRSLRVLLDQQPMASLLNTPIPLCTNSIHTDLVRQSEDIVAFCKPLLLMFLFGAERCCRVALEALSIDDLVQCHEENGNFLPVSYTHLTLPTILLV